MLLHGSAVLDKGGWKIPKNYWPKVIENKLYWTQTKSGIMLSIVGNRLNAKKKWAEANRHQIKNSEASHVKNIQVAKTEFAVIDLPTLMQRGWILPNL